MYAVCMQDDSALNRKIIRRILESDHGNFSNSVIEEADDGVTAVSAVQSAMEAGLTFDCIFMDFVMVSVACWIADLTIRLVYIHTTMYIHIADNDEWS